MDCTPCGRLGAVSKLECAQLQAGAGVRAVTHRVTSSTLSVASRALVLSGHAPAGSSVHRRTSQKRARTRDERGTIMPSTATSSAARPSTNVQEQQPKQSTRRRLRSILRSNEAEVHTEVERGRGTTTSLPADRMLVDEVVATPMTTASLESGSAFTSSWSLWPSCISCALGGAAQLPRPE